MWIVNWASAWVWIMPLIILAMFVVCMLLMVLGRRRWGGCCGCMSISRRLDNDRKPVRE